MEEEGSEKKGNSICVYCTVGKPVSFQWRLRLLRHYRENHSDEYHRDFSHPDRSTLDNKTKKPPPAAPCAPVVDVVRNHHQGLWDQVDVSNEIMSETEMEDPAAVAEPDIHPPRKGPSNSDIAMARPLPYSDDDDSVSSFDSLVVFGKPPPPPPPDGPSKDSNDPNTNLGLSSPQIPPIPRGQKRKVVDYPEPPPEVLTQEEFSLILQNGTSAYGDIVGISGISDFREKFNNKAAASQDPPGTDGRKFMPGDGLDHFVGGSGPYSRENLADYFHFALGAPKSSRKDVVDYPALDCSLPPLIHTNREAAYVQLAKLLDKCGAPRYAFKSVLDWCQDASSEKFDFSKRHPDRDTFDRHISKRVPIPSPKEVLLHRFGEAVADSNLSNWRESMAVIVCDYLSQIFALFNNPDLMHADALDINSPDDPYSPYVPAVNVDAINDGRVFQAYVKNYQRWRHDLEVSGNWTGTPLDDLFTGLVEFIDKTFTDVMGRYNVEPVVVVPSIVKRQYRSDPRYWIILGYVPQPERKSRATVSNEATGAHCTNFHRCLKVIHKQIRVLQATGLPIKAALCGIRKDVNLIMPYIISMGDGQGSDKNCGRFGNYHINGKRIHWKCKVPTKLADMVILPPQSEERTLQEKNREEPLFYQDVHVPTGEMTDDQKERRDLKAMAISCQDPLSNMHCRFVTQQEMHSATLTAVREGFTLEQKTAAKEFLDNHSQHPVELSYYDLDFASAPTGIFGAANTCILHTLNQGIIPKVLDTTLLRMPQKTKTIVDALQKRLFQSYSQSGWVESYARFSFSQITSLTKMTGTERIGVLFCLTGIMRSGIGRTLLSTKTVQSNADAAKEVVIEDERGRTYQRLHFDDHKAIENFAYLNEMLLCFNEWAKRPGLHMPNAAMPEGDVRNTNNVWKAEYSVRCMLRSIKQVHPQVVVRQTDNGSKVIVCGNGWSTQKFHGLTHCVREIINYGVMSNTNAAVGETHHIDFAKKPAKQSQKRSQKEFLHQLAMRNHATLVSSLFADRCRIQTAASRHSVNPNKMESGGNEVTGVVASNKGTKTVVTFRQGRASVVTKSRSSSHFEYGRPVLNELEALFGARQCKVTLSTEYKHPSVHGRPGFLLRAYPGGYRGGDRRWNDWFTADVGDVETFAKRYLPDKDKLDKRDVDLLNDPLFPGNRFLFQALAFIYRDGRDGCRIVARMTWPLYRRGAMNALADDDQDGNIWIRQRKLYYENGEPVIVTLKSSTILFREYVLEDFPFLYENKRDFVRDRNNLFNEYGNVIVEDNHLEHDWVYKCEHPSEWPGFFADWDEPDDPDPDDPDPDDRHPDDPDATTNNQTNH